MFGPGQLAALAAAILKAADGDAINGDVIHLTDVASYLQAELASSHEFLNHRPELWDHCTPALAAAVRRHDHAFDLSTDTAAFNPLDIPGPVAGETKSVVVDRSQLVLPTLRQRFFAAASKRFVPHPVGGLAWAIVVQSALLNERLIDDMQRTASLNGCCLEAAPLPYFLPSPPPEARAAFADYVRCRWPVHVFAIDPITQDQNIADAFTSRRELQLALAVGLASGNLSARNYNQFARQLDLEAETIALNRTVVGFSHGRDTFGWRFYPRFQTPDTESNLKVAMRTLVGAENRDTRLRQRRMEPGRREVTALVLMPSFVPAADLDFRSSWFELTDPDDRRGKLKFAVRHGREVTTLRRQAAHCISACGYRAEDLRLVHRSIDQLERRLPLQTARIQLPYESSLGGFELLTSSTSALAPELKGFYGAPGCTLARESSDKPLQVQKTTIYVVGGGFSVHETRVIAGNYDVTDAEKTKIISREVFQVEIPEGAHVVTQTEAYVDAAGKRQTRTRQYVDVHLATPYGVSNHLLVPVVSSLDAIANQAVQTATVTQAADAAAKIVLASLESQKPLAFGWSDTAIEVCLCLDECQNLVQFCPQDGAKVGFAASAKPPLPIAGTALFAARLTLPGVKTKPQFDPVPITLDKDGKPTDPALAAALLAWLQEQLVANKSVVRTLKSVTLDGYLRLGDDLSDPHAPIYRFPTPLTVTIKPCEKPACAAESMRVPPTTQPTLPEPIRESEGDRRGTIVDAGDVDGSEETAAVPSESNALPPPNASESGANHILPEEAAGNPNRNPDLLDRSVETGDGSASSSDE